MAELLDPNLVRVTPLADGQPGQVDPGAVDVRWAASATGPADCAFQIYINGELAAVATDPGQRELIVSAPTPLEAPALAVQVVQVESSQAGEDFRGLLGPQQGGVRALLRWARLNSADPAATIDVFGNGGAGEIDFATPLNDSPIEWFPDGAGKWGFGLDDFGQDDFGWGGGGCLGLGRGGFGMGEFGFDAPWAEWLSQPLAAGDYRFALVAGDALGNVAAPPPQAELTISPPPPRVGQLSVGVAGDAIVLSWLS